MDFSHTPGWKGDLEINLNSCLIAFSTIFLGMRLYVRFVMTHNPGWDDAMAGLAYVMLIVQSAMDIRVVSYGSGTHMEHVMPFPHIIAGFFEVRRHPRLTRSDALEAADSGPSLEDDEREEN